MKVTPHTLEIRPRNPEGMMSGFNTEVLLDGKPLACTEVRFKVSVDSVAMATITLPANVNVRAAMRVRGESETAREKQRTRRKLKAPLPSSS
jgi:hypothetical protein